MPIHGLECVDSIGDNMLTCSSRRKKSQTMTFKPDAFLSALHLQISHPYAFPPSVISSLWPSSCSFLYFTAISISGRHDGGSFRRVLLAYIEDVSKYVTVHDDITRLAY